MDVPHDDPHLTSEKKSTMSKIFHRFKPGKSDDFSVSTSTLTALESGVSPVPPLKTEGATEAETGGSNAMDPPPDPNNQPPPRQAEKVPPRKLIPGRSNTDPMEGENSVVNRSGSFLTQDEDDGELRLPIWSAEATLRYKPPATAVHRVPDANDSVSNQNGSSSRGGRHGATPNDLFGSIVDPDTLDLEREATLEEILRRDLREQFPSFPKNLGEYGTQDGTQDEVINFLIERSRSVITKSVDDWRGTYEKALERQWLELKDMEKQREEYTQREIGLSGAGSDAAITATAADGQSVELSSRPPDDYGKLPDTPIPQRNQEKLRKGKEGPVSSKTQHITALEKENTRLRSIVAEHKSNWEEAKQALDAARTKHDEEIKEHDKLFQRLQDSNVKAVNQRKQDHQNEMSNLRQEVKQLNDTIARSKQKRKEEQQQALATLKKDMEKEFANSAQKTQRTYEKNMGARNDAHRKEVSSLQEQIRLGSTARQNDIVKLTREYEGKLTDAKRSHDAVIREYRTDLQSAKVDYSDLQNTRQAELALYNRKMEECKSLAEMKIGQAKKQNESDMRAFHAQCNEYLSNKEDEFEHKLKAMSQELATSRDETTALESQHRKAISNLERAHAIEKTKITESYEAKLVTTDLQLKGTTQTLEATEQTLRETKQMLATTQENLNSTEQTLAVTGNTLESTKQDLESARQTHTQAIQALQQTHDAEKAELLQAQKTKEKEYIAKRKEDRRSLQEQVQELRESLLARDEKMYVGTIFYPPDLPRKSDDKLKADFMVVQRMVEEIGGAWEAWKPVQELWTKQVMAKAISQHGERATKKAILQDIVWKQLFQFVFASPFRVFGKEGQRLDTEWAQQCGGSSPSDDNIYYAWPLPGIKAERWRYMTISGCRDTLKTKVSYEDPRSQLKKGFRDSTNELAAKLRTELAAVVDLPGEQEAQMEKLEKLSAKAARMWLDFELHRCRIVIRLTGLAAKSTADTLAMVRKGTFWLTVLPSLGRYGDVDGKELESLIPIAGATGESLRIT